MMITSPENFTYNEPKLKKLAWVLEASQGKFKLFIVRCNYQLLRLQLIGYLQQILTQNILIIELPEDAQDIYSKIKIELGEKTPDILIITGWELVQNVDSLLISANQLREAFAKDFNFPLILWLNDDIYQKMVRFAPDWESWATTREFSLPTEALINSLKEGIEILFNAAFSCEASGFFRTLAMIQDLGHLQRSELQTAAIELQNREQELDPYLQASLEFVQGLKAPNSPVALEHFQNSLQFWQSQLEGQNTEATSDYQLKQALLQYYIGGYYYFNEDWEQSRNYYQQCLDIFEEAKRPDLVAKSVTQLERVLQRLNLWDEWENLASKALELHKNNDIFLHKLAQNYCFLAEVSLQKKKWQEARDRAKKGLELLAKVPENQRWDEGLYLLFIAQAERLLGNLSQSVDYLLKARTLGDRGYPQIYSSSRCYEIR